MCWLDMAAATPQLPPGRYEARCRLKLLPNFSTDELNITATPSTGCGAPITRTYSPAELQRLPSQSAGVAAGWVEMAVGPVDLERQGTVEVRVHATSGQEKRGMLFDCLSVLPGPEQAPGGWCWSLWFVGAAPHRLPTA